MSDYLMRRSANGEAIPFLSKFTTEEVTIGAGPATMRVVVPSGAIYARLKSQSADTFDLYTTATTAEGPVYTVTDDGLKVLLDYEVPVMDLTELFIEGTATKKVSICWKY